MEFSLFAEFHPWVTRALDRFDAAAIDDPALELRLCSAACLVGIVGGEPDAVADRALRDRTEALLPAVPRLDLRTDALFGLCSRASTAGDHAAVLRHVGTLRQLVTDPRHPAWQLFGQRFLANTYYQLGHHEAARRLGERLLHLPTRKVHRGYLGHVPRRVSAWLYLSRIHWIQGRSDDATACLDAGLAECSDADPMALSNFIGLAAIPVVLWQGRDHVGRELLERLEDHVVRHGQRLWYSVVAGYRYALQLRGRAPGGWQGDLPSEALMLASDVYPTLHESLVTPGVLARVEAGAVGWCAPEVLRAHAENLLREDPSGVLAEPVLQRALALARRQGALAWELRAAASLAKLWARRPTLRQRATEMLAGTLARFTQGQETSDAVHAREQLVALERLALGAPHAA